VCGAGNKPLTLAALSPAHVPNLQKEKPRWLFRATGAGVSRDINAQSRWLLLRGDTGATTGLAR